MEMYQRIFHIIRALKWFQMPRNKIFISRGGQVFLHQGGGEKITFRGGGQTFHVGGNAMVAMMMLMKR